ncbi:MAG: RNA polymerase sigma factor [Pseudomonadota bacterium]
MTESVRTELVSARLRLWRFCLSLTRNRASAEDLMQSTCVRILERAHQFRRGTRFDSWMFRIAQTVWLNEVRRDQLRAEQSFSGGDLDELTSPTDPERDAAGRDVLNAVLSLPEAQRVTILLVYVEGFSYAETAEILDIPLGTVMSRIGAGRRSLARGPLGESNGDTTASIASAVERGAALS